MIAKGSLTIRLLNHLWVDRLLICLILLCLLVFNQVNAAESSTPFPVETNDSGIEYANDLLSTHETNSDYRIGPHDLLEIEVFRVDEFSRTVRVNSRGNITLPLLGVISVQNLSSQELELDIANKLTQQFLQQPHVSVFIKEYASQRITVEGEVKKPGIFALTGRTTLLQAIALAEGLTDLADLDDIQLFRKLKDGQTKNYVLNIADIRTGEAKDPILRGNDIIIVHRASVLSFIKRFTDTLRGFIYFGSPFR